MIKGLMHDLIFLAGRLDVAQDLLDTLIAHKDSCIDMATNMIGVKKRIIAFFDKSGRAPTYTVMNNAEIIKKDGVYNTEKSCLSFLGNPRPCKHHKSIKVKYRALKLYTQIRFYISWTVQII